MVEYLTHDDLLDVAKGAVSAEVLVRDHGLIESAAARPATTVFGEDAYPDLHTKAASLFHSLIRNHALVDGNKRLAWAAARVFLLINGVRIYATEAEVVEFVVTVASGEVDTVDKIAAQLRLWNV